VIARRDRGPWTFPWRRRSTTVGGPRIGTWDPGCATGRGAPSTALETDDPRLRLRRRPPGPILPVGHIPWSRRSVVSVSSATADARWTTPRCGRWPTTAGRIRWVAVPTATTNVWRPGSRQQGFVECRSDERRTRISACPPRRQPRPSAARVARHGTGHVHLAARQLRQNCLLRRLASRKAGQPPAHRLARWARTWCVPARHTVLDGRYSARRCRIEDGSPATSPQQAEPPKTGTACDSAGIRSEDTSGRRRSSLVGLRFDADVSRRRRQPHSWSVIICRRVVPRRPMRAAVGKGVRVTQAWSELKRVAPRLPPGSLGSSGITRLGGDASYLRKFHPHYCRRVRDWIRDLLTPPKRDQRGLYRTGRRTALPHTSRSKLLECLEFRVLEATPNLRVVGSIRTRLSTAP